MISDVSRSTKETDMENIREKRDTENRNIETIPIKDICENIK